MECYRKGGCGPYENRSCSDCPASKPEYTQRYEKQTSAPAPKSSGTKPNCEACSHYQACLMWAEAEVNNGVDWCPVWDKEKNNI